jgi:hypothetical protein
MFAVGHENGRLDPGSDGRRNRQDQIVVNVAVEWTSPENSGTRLARL